VEGLTALPARRLAGLLGSREVSVTEVVAAHLDRLAAENPRLNAVVRLAPDAMDRARAADRALAAGAQPGPLHGVPFTAKDNLETAGVVTAIGVPERAGLVPAAALSPCGLGTDSGGSLRVPAHFCGMATLKPTNGLVPVTGVIDDEGPIGALSDPRTQLGPIARTVEDLTLLLGVLAGPDARDAGVAPVPPGDPTTVRVETLRVAVHTADPLGTVTPETAATVAAAAQALASAGARVERPPRPATATPSPSRSGAPTAPE
jgi:amidase